MRAPQPYRGAQPAHARTLFTLALCSALGGAVVVARVALSDSASYIFMLWNLALAWTPYLFSLAAEGLYRRDPSRRWPVLALGAAWLLFLPNAPYIVTDFVHLRQIDNFAWWYDVGLVAIFAWTGCALAAASLGVMRDVVIGMAGRVAAELFVVAAAVLSGLGVYMGRFQRWNSWDALLMPGSVLAEVLAALRDPEALRQVVGVTGLFAALLIVCYVTMTHPAVQLAEAEG
ncbi:MAG: hypothetical protein RLZZ387_5161 [Chloroflexota bacterium]